MTKPTVGRPAFGIAALLIWFIFTFVASKSASKDKHYASSFFGFAAGILLWQFIGEISWHYSVGGVHFVPLESVTTFPLACLFIILLIYGKKYHSFEGGVWCISSRLRSTGWVTTSWRGLIRSSNLWWTSTRGTLAHRWSQALADFFTVLFSCCFAHKPDGADSLPLC